MAEPMKTRQDFSTDSEWYTYMITHPDEFKEDEDSDNKKKNEYEKGIFICEKCGFIIDETEKDFLKSNDNKRIKRDENSNILNCPSCGTSSKNMKKITKEKKSELLRKRKKAREKEEQRNLDIAKENIKDDLMDLLNDLKTRVLDDEIDIKRFVVVFMNLSHKIVKRNAKDLDIDWIEYRKTMLDSCQMVIDAYNVKADAENIMEEYDQDITQDKLYLAEYKYYIEDDKYSIANYEMAERIKEYENMEQSLFKKERERALEQEFQERRKILEEKANKREQRRIERAIS